MSENVARLYLGGSELGPVETVGKEEAELNFECSGTVEGAPLHGSIWAQLTAAQGNYYTFTVEVSFSSSTYTQQLHHVELWRKLVRLYYMQSVGVVFKQGYTDANPSGSEITVAGTDNALDFGSCICAGVKRGVFAGKSAVSIIFTFSQSEASMSSKPFVLKNGDWIVPLGLTNAGEFTSATAKHWSGDWVDAGDDEGFSRVLQDDGSFCVLCRQDAARTDHLQSIVQAVSVSSSVRATQRVSFCVEVVPRPAGGSEATPDIEQLVVIGIQDTTPTNRVVTRERISAQQASPRIIKVSRYMTASEALTVSIEVPIDTDGGTACMYLIKRAWVEFTEET